MQASSGWVLRAQASSGCVGWMPSLVRLPDVFFHRYPAVALFGVALFVAALFVVALFAVVLFLSAVPLTAVTLACLQ